MLRLSRLPLRILAHPLVPRRHVCLMSVSAGTTKRKMLRIGTHNGTFHCDEALGCFMLQKTARFKDTEVVRSRDPEVLKDLDIVIDVGGVYDPSKSSSTRHSQLLTIFPRTLTLNPKLC